jgi:hypothetical protein
MFARHSVLLLKAVFFEDSDSDINALENTEHRLFLIFVINYVIWMPLV